MCFRRREVRQIRKTRGRDAQSAEKLRRLRKELEDARRLVALVRQREVARKVMFVNERQIFEQRAEVKEMKRKLQIKDDDEDLINQKVRILRTVCIVTSLTSSSPRRNSPKHPLSNDLPHHSFVSRHGLEPMLPTTCNCLKMCKLIKKTKYCVTSSRTCRSTLNGTRDMLISRLLH